MLEVSRIVSGSLRQNCYVVASSAADALVIDPGDGVEQVLTHLRVRELRPVAVLITHAHHDHVAGAAEIAERTGAPIHMHSADLRVLRRANLSRVLARGEKPIRLPLIDVDLAGTDTLCFASLEMRVIHTPGHTPGSLCFAIGSDLFTGDTVFATHVGRTDLPEGDSVSLEASLKLLAECFSADTTIRPGHGDAASLGEAMAKARPPALR